MNSGEAVELDRTRRVTGYLGASSDSHFGEVLVGLAQLSPFDYEREREKEAKSAGVRVSFLDAEVAKKRLEFELENSSNLKSIPAWPDDVNGDDLLKEIVSIISSYIILPKGAREALALWILGTFCYDNFRIWPKLLITSPEKRCGKTTLMEMLVELCCKGFSTSNISTAAMYRAIDLWKPTLIIDEADTFIHGNSEMRGIINSGHTKATASVLRVSPGGNGLTQISTWSPMVIGMINRPPDTILDRSIVIQLQRKRVDEKTAKLPINFDSNSHPLYQKMLRWSSDHHTQLKNHQLQALPKSQNDRALDNWTPLLSIAEIIGGDWPQKASMTFSLLTLTDDEESIGQLLLSDIKEIFDNQEGKTIFSVDLVRMLSCLEERPWAEWTKNKAITTIALARLLKPFGIKPKQIRVEKINRNGYCYDAFKDAFDRYIVVPDIQISTTLQTSDTNDLSESSKTYCIPYADE